MIFELLYFKEHHFSIIVSFFYLSIHPPSYILICTLYYGQTLNFNIIRSRCPRKEHLLRMKLIEWDRLQFWLSQQMSAVTNCVTFSANLMSGIAWTCRGVLDNKPIYSSATTSVHVGHFAQAYAIMHGSSHPQSLQRSRWGLVLAKMHPLHWVTAYNRQLPGGIEYCHYRVLSLRVALAVSIATAT